MSVGHQGGAAPALGLPATASSVSSKDLNFNDVNVNDVHIDRIEDTTDVEVEDNYVGKIIKEKSKKTLNKEK